MSDQFICNNAGICKHRFSSITWCCRPFSDPDHPETVALSKADGWGTNRDWVETYCDQFQDNKIIPYIPSDQIQAAVARVYTDRDFKMYQYARYDKLGRPVVYVCIIRAYLGPEIGYRYWRGQAVCSERDFGKLSYQEGARIARERAWKGFAVKTLEEGKVYPEYTNVYHHPQVLKTLSEAVFNSTCSGLLCTAKKLTDGEWGIEWCYDKIMCAMPWSELDSFDKLYLAERNIAVSDFLEEVNKGRKEANIPLYTFDDATEEQVTDPREEDVFYQKEILPPESEHIELLDELEDKWQLPQKEGTAVAVSSQGAIFGIVSDSQELTEKIMHILAEARI